MTSIVVSSGQTSSGLVISSGEVLTVQSGGQALTTTVDKGGVAVVSGGTAHGIAITQGELMVEDGGFATGVVLKANATATVVSASISGLTVSSGTVDVGADAFLLMGSATNAVVAADSGAVIIRLTLGENATLDVYDGASATLATLSGGTATVYDGGVISAASVTQGSIYLLSGAIAHTDTIYAGAAEVVSSGASPLGEVLSGGEQIVSAGGKANDTVIHAGGLLLLSSGAVASAALLARGGDLLVLPGAQALGVRSGGGALISTGIVLLNSGALVAAGSSLGGSYASATEYVLAGGTALSQTLGSQLSQTVFSGGVASKTVLSAGATQIVLSGGVARNEILSSGAVQSIGAGASPATTVLAGGNQSVIGLASATIIGSAAIQTVQSGGIARGDVVMSGGKIILSGGTLHGAAVAGFVTGSGTLYDTTISSGGSVSGNQIVSAASIEAGGVLSVGGSATSITVGSGGTLNVATYYGTADGVVVYAGGYAQLDGDELGVSLAGTADVYSGTASGTVVQQGGVERLNTTGYPLYGYGTEQGGSVLSGGVLMVRTGVVKDETISAGGLLVLNEGDLEGVTIQSGATVVDFRSGSLSNGNMVQSGAQVASTGIVLVSSGMAPQVITPSAGTVNIGSGATAFDLTSSATNPLAVQPGGELVLTYIAPGYTSIQGYYFQDSVKIVNNNVLEIYTHNRFDKPIFEAQVQLEGNYTGDFGVKSVAGALGLTFLGNAAPSYASVPAGTILSAALVSAGGVAAAFPGIGGSNTTPLPESGGHADPIGIVLAHPLIDTPLVLPHFR